MAQNAHVMIVPFPSQGHVRPLLKLAFQIADHGIKVTFVNTESVQAKLVASSMNKERIDGIVFATVPNGWKDGGAPEELKSNMMKVLPGFVEGLIKKELFSCVIADGSLGWILQVAERNGINHAGFFPLAVGSVALATHIPDLIKTQRIDTNGTMVESDEIINLSQDIPSWKNNELTWNYPRGASSLGIQKLLFDICLSLQQTVDHEKWIICNTCYEIETPACSLIPNMLPVGPLIGREGSLDQARAGAGSFSPEDTSSLSWLDKKTSGSVIYIAFGSVAVVSQDQLNELALGLELSGRPFLWVVRPDLANGETANYPDGFLERVADLGKIIEWAPQEKVLAHPSVACFISHCGWNSTIEGLTMGVPFLCFPSFGDQFHNQSYISDIWKIGLKLVADQNGIINCYEIQTKIEILMSDDSFKVNSVMLKKIVHESVSKGGSSFKNFETFINFLKQ